ncbi:hypothetical protein Tco_1286554 [Tanacetum coccineum]
MVLYVLGFLYLSIDWQLASVISVVEESCYGLRSVTKAMKLVKGNMLAACMVSLTMYVLIGSVEFMYTTLVVYNGAELVLVLRMSVGIGNLKKRITTTDIPDEWDQTVQEMGNFQSTKSIWNILKGIGIATCVYYIWKERNDRIFTQEKKPYSQVLQSINKNIKLQLMSLTIKKSTNSIRVVELWEVKFNFME